MHYQNISMNSNPENDLNTEKIVDAIVQDQNETVSTEENQNITVPPGTVPLSPRNGNLALPENTRIMCIIFYSNFMKNTK